MPLKEELTNKIESFFNDPYVVKETSIVPDTDYSKLTFGNTGLTSEFAFLFVDIRKSSKLHETFGYEKAARVYQSFHEINVRIILANAGNIRSFDGDRTMGVFAGDYKNSNAVKAGMSIMWAIRNILNPKLSSNVLCGIGIDYGKILITKVGKGSNPNNYDLVWVGPAANYASHLSTEANDTIIISDRSYKKLNDTRKISNGNNMWRQIQLTLKNKQQIICYESGYSWNF
jgi:adenylate cyclase